MSNPEEKNGDLWVFGAAALLILSFLWYGWTKYSHIIVNTSIDLTLYLTSLNATIHNVLPDIRILKEIAFLLVPEEFLYKRVDIENILRSINPLKPTLTDLKLAWSLLGHVFRGPIVIYALYLTWKVMCSTRPLRMKRSFNIFSLARLNIAHSPHIRHAIQNEIHKTPYNVGPHRQEEGCIRFAIILGAIKYIDNDGVELLVKLSNQHSIDSKNNIFYIEDSYDEDEGLPLIHRKCMIDKSVLKIEFQKQISNLGVWKGFDELPRHAKALAAVFLYLIKGGKINKDKAFTLLRKFNLSYQKKTKKKSWNIDDSEVDGIIEKFKHINAVKNTITPHYYNVTALTGLYFKATYLKTKLPPTMFYWLKEVDRGLWYALHQNLSPASWCEAAGVRSIELVEKKLNTPCSFPYVQGAIKGIMIYLDDEGWPISTPESLKKNKI